MKYLLVVILALMLSFSMEAQEEVSYEQALKKVQKTNFKLDDKSVEINKEAIEASAPMINLFLKYQDGDKKVNQGDFDQMLNQMGIMDDVQNDKSGLTKEDAFKFIDAYIKADQGERIDIDQEKKDKVLEYLNQLEQGEKDTEQIFNQVVTDDQVNEFVKQAQAEIAKLQSAGFGISYKDFRKEAKKKKPNVTDAEIQKAYKELMKQLSF
ncbi:MAG: hypothetical protein J7K34_10930 [Flavobacteriaceae bacterium]|nr:hypothetical protein [Flavobacteriaceae bacterium]